MLAASLVAHVLLLLGLILVTKPRPVEPPPVRSIDVRIIIVTGLVMTGTAIWWTGHLTKDSAFWELLGPQVFRGFRFRGALARAR